MVVAAVSSLRKLRFSGLGAAQRSITFRPLPAACSTRAPPGQGPALNSGVPRLVTVTGGPCAIPPMAKAIAANITAVGSTGRGNVRVYPGDGMSPLASALNFGAGQTRANNGIFALASNGDGTIAVLATVAGGGTVNIVLDIAGYFCSGIPDVPDALFEDTNCDGIDGDAAHAIFVATSGNDLNAGTMAAPVATLSNAISLAQVANPKKDVYVAGGTYAVGTLQLASGVSLYGLYDDERGPGTATGRTSPSSTARTTAVLAQSLTAETHVEGFQITAVSAVSRRAEQLRRPRLQAEAVSSSCGTTPSRPARARRAPRA